MVQFVTSAFAVSEDASFDNLKHDSLHTTDNQTQPCNTTMLRPRSSRTTSDSESNYSPQSQGDTQLRLSMSTSAPCHLSEWNPDFPASSSDTQLGLLMPPDLDPQTLTEVVDYSTAFTGEMRGGAGETAARRAESNESEGKITIQRDERISGCTGAGRSKLAGNSRHMQLHSRELEPRENLANSNWQRDAEKHRNRNSTTRARIGIMGLKQGHDPADLRSEHELGILRHDLPDSFHMGRTSDSISLCTNCESKSKLQSSRKSRLGYGTATRTRSRRKALWVSPALSTCFTIQLVLGSLLVSGLVLLVLRRMYAREMLSDGELVKGGYRSVGVGGLAGEAGAFDDMRVSMPIRGEAVVYNGKAVDNASNTNTNSNSNFNVPHFLDVDNAFNPNAKSHNASAPIVVNTPTGNSLAPASKSRTAKIKSGGTDTDASKPPLVDRLALLRLGIIGRAASSAGAGSGSGPGLGPHFDMSTPFVPHVGLDLDADFSREEMEIRSEPERVSHPDPEESRPPPIFYIPNSSHGKSKSKSKIDTKSTPSSSSSSLLSHHDSTYCRSPTSPQSSLSPGAPGATPSQVQSQRCRLLLPLLTTEQESKARLHIRQMAYLARVLGRVLVVPECGAGRVGVGCMGGAGGGAGKDRLKWDAAMYWDVRRWTRTERPAAGVDTQEVVGNTEEVRPWAITMPEFLEWVAARPERAKARVVRLLPASAGSSANSSHEPFSGSESGTFDLPGARITISTPSIPPATRAGGRKHRAQQNLTAFDAALSCLARRAAKLEFGVFGDVMVVNATLSSKALKGQKAHITHDGTRFLPREDILTGPFARSVLDVLGGQGLSTVRTCDANTGLKSELNLNKSRGSEMSWDGVGVSEAQTLNVLGDMGNEQQVNELADLESDAEVLVVDWQLKYPLFDFPTVVDSVERVSGRDLGLEKTEFPPALEYSPRLVRLSSILVDLAKGGELEAGHRSEKTDNARFMDTASPNTGPDTKPRSLIVIHWRMETIPAENLPMCADALVSTLRRIVEEVRGLGRRASVWLATDFPYAVGEDRGSDTDVRVGSADGDGGGEDGSKRGAFRSRGVGRGPEVRRGDGGVEMEVERDHPMVVSLARTETRLALATSTSCPGGEPSSTTVTRGRTLPVIETPTPRRALTGSGTFKGADVREGHWVALRKVREAFTFRGRSAGTGDGVRDLEGDGGGLRGVELLAVEGVLRLLGIVQGGNLLARQTGSDEKADALLTRLGLSRDLVLDSGTLGILDKIVASRAEWFVAGGEGCAKGSSYTRQIVEMRERAAKRGEQFGGNLAEYFRV